MRDIELEERLAKWAGFAPLPKVGITWWIYPRGGGIDGRIRKAVPKFTTSLDACFKWLVPKVKFFSISSGEGDFFNGNFTASLFYTDDLIFFMSEADTPALATCKAIEQLIKQTV